MRILIGGLRLQNSRRGMSNSYDGITAVETIRDLTDVLVLHTSNLIVAKNGAQDAP